jgi:hypothetical protein
VSLSGGGDAKSGGSDDPEKLGLQLKISID